MLFRSEAGQDLDTLLAAARIVGASGTAVEIHVAGTGRLEAKVRADAAATTGSCRVIVHGLLPRGPYAELLGRADVGIVAVKPESLVAVPYKACDYAAAGLAIVSGLRGELAEVLDEYRAGICYEAGDAASLAGEIGTLAADRTLLATLRQGARRLAEQRFDRETTYPRFARWIETLAD